MSLKNRLAKVAERVGAMRKSDGILIQFFGNPEGGPARLLSFFWAGKKPADAVDPVVGEPYQEKAEGESMAEE